MSSSTLAVLVAPSTAATMAVLTVGAAAWLVARRLKRSKWNGRPAGIPRDEVTHIVAEQRPEDVTVVLPWAERAARAAAMRSHPSLYRPSRSGLEALARSVDEALANVDQARSRYAFPHVVNVDDTTLLPRSVDVSTLADAEPVELRLYPPTVPPVIDNTEPAEGPA